MLDSLSGRDLICSSAGSGSTHDDQMPTPSIPMILNRSTSGSGSTLSMACGSSKTLMASSNATPCFWRSLAALAGSHSKLEHAATHRPGTPYTSKGPRRRAASSVGGTVRPELTEAQKTVVEKREQLARVLERLRAPGRATARRGAAQRTPPVEDGRYYWTSASHAMVVAAGTSEADPHEGSRQWRLDARDQCLSREPGMTRALGRSRRVGRAAAEGLGRRGGGRRLAPRAPRPSSAWYWTYPGLVDR